MLPMSDKQRVLAAVDVGTNSFHLVVVRLLDNNQFSTINREKIVVRLGEGPKEFKRLTDEAMSRGIEAMRMFVSVAERAGAPIRAVATSAVREAANGEEFVRRVRAATGVEMEVVSGFEEARLIYLGVLQALPVYNDRVALVDIGGGSTEFLIGERGRTRYANSLKIGAIRMTQRFFPKEAVTAKQVEACRALVRGEIYHAAQEIRASGCRTLIATSGTVQTVAAMAMTARGESITDSLNGVHISRREVSEVLDMVLATRSMAQRERLPGIDPRRADIITAGAVVLETILQECDADGYIVSSYALREGIVLDTISKLAGGRDGLAHLSDLRYESIMRIGRMYNFDEGHGRHVADLALSIYDQLADVHRLEDDSRELLEAAALLHDVGYYISHANHHKHSLYLIQNSETLGFNNEELAVIANVARYHRKSHPKNGHPAFAALRRSDQRRVRVLAAILRVADGLDRTHDARVRSVRVDCSKRSIMLRLACDPGANLAFELWSLNRKKALLEEVFERTVNVEVPKEATVPAVE